MYDLFKGFSKKMYLHKIGKFQLTYSWEDTVKNGSLEGLVNTAKPKVYNQWLIQELIWVLVPMWASPCDVSFAPGGGVGGGSVSPYCKLSPHYLAIYHF